MKRRTLLTGAALFVAVGGGVAHAQSLQGTLSQDATPSNFARDRNVSVQERRHPEYEALGIRTGAFLVWPKLTVANVYDDNIFATPDDTVADGVTTFSPELQLTSNWSRHSVGAYARGDFSQYWQNSNQNSNSYTLGARGQLDIQRTAQINAGAEFAHLTESRTSAATEGNAFPVLYDETSLNLSAYKELNRLRFTGRVDWQHFDYSDRAGNSPQSDRDRDVTIATLQAAYAVSPDTAVFLEVAGNDRNYRYTSSPTVNGVPLFPGFVNRDSQGVQILAGANFEIGALMRGELGVGYLHQTYSDDQFNDVSGPGARLQVEWFPTQLTTVTATGTRTVEDSGLSGASTYLSNNFALKVDHELLRNVVLRANAGYGHDKYRGISRIDKRFLAGFGGTYLLNRNVGVSLGYSFFKQNSDGSNPSVVDGSFTINQVLATLTLQY